MVSSDSKPGFELPEGFPVSKWRYIDRLLASYGHPADKAGRKWLRELRDRAVTHEMALREITQDDTARSDGQRLDEVERLARLALEEGESGL